MYHLLFSNRNMWNTRRGQEKENHSPSKKAWFSTKWHWFLTEFQQGCCLAICYRCPQGLSAVRWAGGGTGCSRASFPQLSLPQPNSHSRLLVWFLHTQRLNWQRTFCSEKLSASFRQLCPMLFNASRAPQERDVPLHILSLKPGERDLVPQKSSFIHPAHKISPQTIALLPMGLKVSWGITCRFKSQLRSVPVRQVCNEGSICPCWHLLWNKIYRFISPLSALKPGLSTPVWLSVILDCTKIPSSVKSRRQTVNRANKPLPPPLMFYLLSPVFTEFPLLLD